MNKFVAIDFETSYGHIPCSIGIALFENGEIKDTFYTLIKPIDLKFNRINSNINGIYLEHVENYEYFDKYWNQINKFIKGNLIVAHNASTDLSILQKTVTHYNLDIESYEYVCTLQLAKQKLEIENYKLSTLANHFNIDQTNYHNALDDAIVCGKLFLELNKLNQNNISKEFIKRNLKINNHSRKNDFLKDKFTLEYTQVSNKFNGLIMVVSGKFEHFSRDEIKEIIEANGGKNGSSITGKTSVVVAGVDMGPAKLEKATKLEIAIWNENEFIEKLKNI